MRRRIKGLGAAVLFAGLLAGLSSGCAGKAGEAQGGAQAYPAEAVELLAPAGRGSGYDLTARAVSQCLQGLVGVPLPVTNKPGDGGSAALGYLDGRRGEDAVLSVFSPPVCLIHLNGTTPLSYRESTTPIAMLLVDYGCFAVRSDSPYETIGQVMEALKEDPACVKVGGTSSAWSMDHIQFLNAARAAGVERLWEIPYEGYENGGAASQLISGRIGLLSAGVSDVAGLMESGELRVLAVTSGERLEEGLMAQVPTCREEGIDAVFSNWRGIFGPKDMPEYAVEYWEDTLEAMSESSQWQECCMRYQWTMDYMGHEEFSDFLEQSDKEYEALLEAVRGEG